MSVRSKHIDVVYPYIRTDDMLADMFTKPVPGNKLQLCCNCSTPITLKECSRSICGMQYVPVL